MGNGCSNPSRILSTTSQSAQSADIHQSPRASRQNLISYPQKLTTLDEFEELFFQKEHTFEELSISNLQINSSTLTCAIVIKIKCKNVSTQTMVILSSLSKVLKPRKTFDQEPNIIRQNSPALIFNQADILNRSSQTRERTHSRERTPSLATKYRYRPAEKQTQNFMHTLEVTNQRRNLNYSSQLQKLSDSKLKDQDCLTFKIV